MRRTRSAGEPHGRPGPQAEERLMIAAGLLARGEAPCAMVCCEDWGIDFEDIAKGDVDAG